MQFLAEDTVDKSHFQGSVLGALGQKVALTILAGCFFVTIASSAVAQPTSSRVSIDAFGELYVTAMAAPEDQARVFVYRSGQTQNASPVNIYLNGQYHASLLRGGFTEFCAAPGAVNIKAALDDASRLHASKLDAGQRLELKAGQTNFLKVDESTPSAIGLLSGTAAQTKAEIEGTRRQIHTISRAKAALTCGQPAAVAAAAVRMPPPLRLNRLFLANTRLKRMHCLNLARLKSALLDTTPLSRWCKGCSRISLRLNASV
jgi:OOP family OmpA-OmpF porin